MDFFFSIMISGACRIFVLWPLRVVSGNRRRRNACQYSGQGISRLDTRIYALTGIDSYYCLNMFNFEEESEIT